MWMLLHSSTADGGTDCQWGQSWSFEARRRRPVHFFPALQCVDIGLRVCTCPWSCHGTCVPITDVELGAPSERMYGSTIVVCVVHTAQSKGEFSLAPIMFNHPEHADLISERRISSVFWYETIRIRKQG